MREDPPRPEPTLLYLAYEYPVLTQTFTVNEVRGLSARGIRLEVFSCRPARPREEELAEAAGEVPVLVGEPPLSLGSLRSFMGWLCRRPIRTAALLGTVASAAYRDEARRCWARGFLQLLWGARLAAKLRKRRVRPHLHAQFVDAASTVALVAARLLDLPFSITNHTAYNPYLLVPKLRHARFLVSISEYDRRLVRRMTRGVRPTRVHVVYQGIDASGFAGERRPVRDPGPFRLLSVAALREKKGHHVLLAAVKSLVAEGRDVRLTIVGEGPERRRLEILARDLGLADRVELPGAEPPSAVRRRYGVADSFALACVKAGNGDLDGIPISLMEAMAAGVPVVSTRLSGIPELVVHNHEGLLADPGDAEDLADRIREVMDDPGRAAELARRGREKVLRQHDLGRSVDRMARLLGAEPA